MLTLYRYYLYRRERVEVLERKIEQAEERADADPGKAKFAWDLARVKLEAYFDRNLAQINLVFIAAMVVMGIGFVLVILGVSLSFRTDHVTPVQIVSAGAGIITEFIGATFMAIYRSTMAQANEFMSILERINTVGMAVQVLDSIPESEPALKNEMRAQIVGLLLTSKAESLKRQSPKSEAAEKAKSQAAN